MKVLAAFITLISGSCALVVPRAVREVSSIAELEFIINENPKVATNFCARQNGAFTIVESVFKELSDKFTNVVFAKVDINRVGIDKVTQKYQINAIPTFITFKDGKEIGARVVSLLRRVIERQIGILAAS